MALITRLSRLFKADLNAVIDQLEEPDMLLKQAIREMEASITSGEEDITRKDHQLKQIEQQHNQINTQLDSIEEEINVCFSSQEDQLAKDAIKRKLEQGKIADELKRQIQSLNREVETLKTNHKKQLTILESMHQKASVLVNQEVIHKVDQPRTHFHSISDAEVEIAFLQEQQKRNPS